MVNLTSETPYTEAPNINTTITPLVSNGYFDTKIQSVFSQSYQVFEKQQEELQSMFARSGKIFEENMNNLRI